ncbi:phage tail protein [Lacticaseibacillus paracasei]|uniref:phage tail protein n=1 Tax=Lacticaseibacillus paracasei TaxID=1597 RepID=UPI001891D822|nr:phage tail protein [Lacticaseibacillus paracasei]QPB57149.1 hypothetical protein GFB64_08625 [Lacticaseibacillus paracasei]WPQ29471.1 phage tail protein [Lacticaseibacillus paracasei]
MYQVTAITGDRSIVIMRPDGLNAMLTGASIKEEMNTIPSFSFSMLPNNPGYNQMMPLVTQVIVKRIDTGDILFDGRVLVPTNDMAESGVLTRDYTCEGALGYLHDVVLGYQTIIGSPAAIIKQLIDQFNSQVEPFKQIKLGVMPESPNIRTLKTSAEKDLYDTLHDFVATTLGYDMRARSDTDGRFLDVKSQLGDVSPTVIKLGVNLKSMSIEEDPTSMITRLVPLGAVKEGANDATTGTDEVQPRVNLTDAGKPLFIDIPDLISIYGVQSGVQVFDDAKTPTDVEMAAKSWISGQRPVLRKFSISALDLSLIGKAPEDFKVYNFYRVVNPATQTDEVMRVIGETLDLIKPQNAELTIGNKFKSAIDFATENLNAGQSIGSLRTNLKQQNVRIVAANETAKAAQETVSKVQATVVELQESLEKADLSGINHSLTEMNSQLSSLFSNIGEIDVQLSKVQAAQKTPSGATLETLEKRIELLEKTTGPDQDKGKGD